VVGARSSKSFLDAGDAGVAYRAVSAAVVEFDERLLIGDDQLSVDANLIELVDGDAHAVGRGWFKARSGPTRPCRRELTQVRLEGSAGLSVLAVRNI
jgi:hypothetical protein